MPIVPAPAKVLVTGASGFLAVHCVTQLLKDGYNVIGAVRSPSKGKYLTNTFENYSGRFSYVIVPDIEKEDAFDEAVKGVDGILHTASPFHLAADDPQELIGPAVAGTVGILKSAAKFGPSVRRIVVTSSSAAIMSPKDAPYNFTEADWNEPSPANVEKFGSKAAQGDKYRASKTLAEKAAWKWVEDNKSSINFDLTVMNPPFIFGPVLQEISSFASLNESNARLAETIKTPSGPNTIGAFVSGYVDVRDAALAHSLALQKDEAGGKRFLISAGVYSWQDCLDELRAAGVANIPKGHPSDAYKAKYHSQDSTRARTVLGITFIPFRKTLVDTVESIRARFPGEL